MKERAQEETNAIIDKLEVLKPKPERVSRISEKDFERYKPLFDGEETQEYLYSEWIHVAGSVYDPVIVVHPNGEETIIPPLLNRNAVDDTVSEGIDYAKLVSKAGSEGGRLPEREEQVLKTGFDYISKEILKTTSGTSSKQDNGDTDSDEYDF